MSDNGKWWIGNSDTDPLEVSEERVLDLIWESLPDTVQADLFGVTERLQRAELYLNVDGECWRVMAERHRPPVQDVESEHD